MYLPDPNIDKEFERRIAVDFDYSQRITRLYGLELRRKVLQDELEKCIDDINEIRNDLPDDVYKQYEMIRVIDILKGPNEICKAE